MERAAHIECITANDLSVAAPWFVKESIDNPEFPQFFFIHEHLQRYTSTVHARYQPWYFFLAILFVGILPWLVTMIDALRAAWKAPRAQHFDPTLFLLVWVGVIFAFFSFSDSKLPSYILPIFPALALLIALRLSAIRGKVLALQLVSVSVIALVGLCAVPYTVLLATPSLPAALYKAQIPWLYAAGVILLVGSLISVLYACRERVKSAVLICALTGLVTTQLLVTSEDALSPSHSTYHLIPQLQPYLRPETPFYSVRGYEQTLPFYIDRTLTLVDYPG